MTKLTIQLIVAAVIVIVVGFGVRSWLKNRDEARDNKAAVEQSDRTGKATVEIADKGIVAQEQATALDNEVGAQRVEIIHKYEALRNENQIVRAYDDGAVPDELRRLARERRIARDRLGGDQAGSEHDDAAEAAGR